MELPTTNTCFRVVARAGLALESPSETRWLQPVQARRLAEHARGLVGSLLTRRDSQVKEALGAVLDAVSVLEREIDLLHRRFFLESSGVAMRDRDIALGADGFWLYGPSEEERELLSQGHARVFLELSSRGATQLLDLDVQVAGWSEDAVDLVFSDPDPALVDVVVGYVFARQRSDRRRELDSEGK